jgi:integrase
MVCERTFLMDVIHRRMRLRRLDCPYVFHRSGRPIRSFRKAFKLAAKEIGYPELLPHDMRRSAVRNFRKAGLSEHEAFRSRD